MGGANEHWGFRNPVMKETKENERQKDQIYYIYNWN